MSMLAFELLLPWDGGDNRFRFIPCPKSRLACHLGFGGDEHGLRVHHSMSMLTFEPLLP